MDREEDGGKDGIWRLAVLMDGSQLDQSFEDLSRSPLWLLAWFSTGSPPPPARLGEATALAVGKISLLDTFDNIHEYQTKKGVQLRAARTTRCRYPHVTLASYHCMDADAQEPLLMNLPDGGQCLERHTGLSRPTSPTILLASPIFLASQGYSHMELVWVQITRPLPLERVVVSGGRGGTIPLSPIIMSEAIQQLSELVGRETVVFRQGAAFSLPGKFSRAGEEEGRHGVVELTVLESFPVLQGMLTRETEVVVLPHVEGEVFSSLGTSGRSLSLSNLPLGETSTLEESIETRSFTASNCSASDFRNDDDDEEEAGSTSDPSLELLTHPELKLHRNYVLVPRQFAQDHELLQYQMVVLEPAGGSPLGQGLADMVISTHPPREEEVGQSHSAILMWYDGQSELERYLPPPYPGFTYHEAVLRSAFVHPHLMYALFSETLSPFRRYSVTMKTGKGKKDGALPDLPKAKVVTMAQVGVAVPQRELDKEETKQALMNFFQQRTHLLMTGDIFGVNIEGAGAVFYRLMETDPPNSQRCDSSCLREISWSLKNFVHCPLPCECPPCPLLPPPPYFSRLLPPGLEVPCLSLFSLLLPLLYSHPSLRPPRTPAILLTGPSGVGKTTAVRAVARRTRVHLLELNCYQYCSEPVATAEKRFMADSARALECAPCLVLFRNIHMIGRDAKKDEPRLAAAFLSFMSYISQHNKKSTVDFPILVVGTAPKREGIPAQVAMEMLHEVELATPTETQRLAMLTGLGSEHLVSPSVPWTQLARQTAGFVLGDVVSLFSRASNIAISSVFQQCGESSAAGLELSGVSITHSHLQEALTRISAAHSDAIGAPKIPDVRWEDVGGLAEAKQEVLDAIQLPLTHPHLFTHGLRRSGVLLYGPPGTGKTLLAKAVATECGVNFMSVKGPELINMYVGQTEENVRDIFARARGAAPCIIFFDELDSIAPSRGKTGDASGVMDRVVSQLLAELDGLQKSGDVFVIGATNRVDLLDSALLRPGRFDRLVYLGISDDVQSRVKILTAITRKFNLAADVDLCDLATRCPARVTGADLYALCSEALLQAVRQLVQRSEVTEEEESLVVSSEHFNWALSRLTPSVSEAQLQRYQKLRQQEEKTPTLKEPS